jgi:spermidine synthase
MVLEGWAEPAQVVERRAGVAGEVVLRRRGERFEIIANGCFLMDTSDGRSERLLVDAALDALAGDDLSVLIGGLGVGFSLARAAAQPRWGRIAVVERERAVIDWHHRGHLAPFSAGALADPRVTVIESDLLTCVRARDARYDALCLDIDNGPDWTVTDSNESLYSPAGLADCQGAAQPRRRARGVVRAAVGRVRGSVAERRIRPGQDRTGAGCPWCAGCGASRRTPVGPYVAAGHARPLRCLPSSATT